MVSSRRLYLINLQDQRLWSLHACGQHAILLPPGEGVSVSAKSREDIAVYLIWRPGPCLKNALDCFPWSRILSLPLINNCPDLSIGPQGRQNEKAVSDQRKCGTWKTCAWEPCSLSQAPSLYHPYCLIRPKMGSRVPPSRIVNSISCPPGTGPILLNCLMNECTRHPLQVVGSLVDGGCPPPSVTSGTLPLLPPFLLSRGL